MGGCRKSVKDNVAHSKYHKDMAMKFSEQMKNHQAAAKAVGKSIVASGRRMSVMN